MRMPCEYLRPLARSCSFAWGRKPNQHDLHAHAFESAPGPEQCAAAFSGNGLPAMPTTKVLPRWWTYGATDLNQGTKVKLNTADMGRFLQGRWWQKEGV
jgi:hypothetical protein